MARNAAITSSINFHDKKDPMPKRSSEVNTFIESVLMFCIVS